jgi:hypothetical protein
VSPTHPPASLPRAYLAIWRALKEADDRAGSRQELAARLGVSTHTIQRILVRGDVPSFPGEESTRVLHSWVRSLSRMAARLEEDPRTWIENVGVEWTDEIARISAGASSARGTRRAPSSRRTISGDLQGAVIRVGIVPRTPFGEPLPETGTSFLEAISRRMLGAMDPSTSPRIEVLDQTDRVDGSLFSSRFDLMVGLPETTAGRRNGLWFVPIPGWITRLEAICTAHAPAVASLSRWSAWTAATCDTPVLAIMGSASQAYLFGPSGISGSRIRIVANGDPRSLAEVFLDHAADGPAGAAILLLDDSSTAAEVDAIARAMIQEMPAGEHERIIFPMEDAAVAPAFPICFVGREASPVRPELLRSAIECELLGAGAIATAQLYAALAAGSLLPLEDFSEATPAFRMAVCDGLVSLVHPPEYSRTLVPLSWHPHLDAALRGEPEPIRPTVSIHQCQSCSASLDDGVHGGVSDRYCRFCSDEQGRLRPREQVHGILARWLQDWQEGISEPEARRRAATFMRSMPAWSHN